MDRLGHRVRVATIISGGTWTVLALNLLGQEVLTNQRMSDSGVSRNFVRGVLSFRRLYDCACVNSKCYPYDFRTRRGPRQVVVL